MRDIKLKEIIEDLIEFLLFILVGIVFIMCPLRLSVLLGKSLAKLLYETKNKKIKALLRYEFVINNIKKRLNLERAAAEQIAKKMYINLGQNLAEFFHIPFINKNYIKKNIIFEGEERLREVLKNNNKALLISGHFGNWELLQIIYALLGYKILVIAYPQHNPLTNFVINCFRKRMGTKVLPTHTSYKELINSLQDRDIIGIVADQYYVKEAGGIMVKFLNFDVYATKAPAILALRKNLSLFVTLLIRLSHTKHLLKLIGPINGNDIKNLTQAWNDVLTEYIRKYPEQWFWLHRRFRN